MKGKRLKQQILALTLSLCMVVGLAPMTAAAAELQEAVPEAAAAENGSEAGQETDRETDIKEAVPVEEATVKEVQPEEKEAEPKTEAKEKGSAPKEIATYANTKGISVMAEDLQIIDYGYEAKAVDAAKAAKVKNSEVNTESWIDQTAWVTFSRALTNSEKVYLTFGSEEIQIGGAASEVLKCEGNGSSRTFAWSFLNPEQSDGWGGAVSGTWELSAQLEPEGKGVDFAEGVANTIEIKKPDAKVYPAILGDGTGKFTGSNEMETDDYSDFGVGDYKELYFSTDGLKQTQPSDPGQSTKAYWLGYAVVAPEGAAGFKYVIADNAAGLNTEKAETSNKLEKDVYNGKDGFALYYDLKGKEDLSGIKAWTRLTWIDGNGKGLGTYVFHVNFMNVTYVVDDVDFELIDFGFKSAGKAANDAINDGLTWLREEVNAQDGKPEDVDDSVENTMYVVFKAATESSDKKYTVKFSRSVGEEEEEIYRETTEAGVKRGGAIYYSFNDQAKDKTTGAGEYAATIYQGEDENGIFMIKIYLDVFDVTFDAGNGGKFANGKAPEPVLAMEIDADEMAKPAVTPDSGMRFKSWDKKLDWEKHTIIYTAQWEKIPEVAAVDKTAAKNQINKGIKATQSGKKVKLTWGKVSAADGYEIYAAKCGKSYKLAKKVSGNKKVSLSLTKISGKKVNKKYNYKLKVKAYRMVNGKKEYIATSYGVHVAGSSQKKYTNAKKVSVSKSKITLKKGKTKKIKATIKKQRSRKKIYPNSHVRKFRYFSTNTKVATVSKSGKVKAKGKGSCTVYVMAANGVKKAVKVTVK